MALKLLPFLLLFGVQPVHAQVIEIDELGSARTYDSPAVFTADRADPIVQPVRTRRKAAELVPSTMIVQAALAHGLDPSLLEAVAWQESRGRMDAVSRKGALGVMQLMPGTAAELNVDPLDVKANLRGGALYLRRQLDRFAGNVPLALAAYNAGPGAVQKFGGIPPFRETQQYVSLILGRWRTKSAIAFPFPTIEAGR